MSLTRTPDVDPVETALAGGRPWEHVSFMWAGGNLLYLEDERKEDETKNG